MRQTVSHEDIMNRLDNGDGRFRKVEEDLDDIKADVAEMKETLVAIKDMVEAWTAAKTAGRFIKWLGGVAAGLAAIFVALKAGIDWR